MTEEIVALGEQVGKEAGEPQEDASAREAFGFLRDAVD